MKSPAALALLSFAPVALLALAFPHMLASLITVAFVGEISFFIPVSKRLVELKNERGQSVPFRERYPLLLWLPGIFFYWEIAQGAPSELNARALAIAGAASFAASKIWLGEGKLWPYRGAVRRK